MSAFADDCVGEAAEKAVAAMKNGDILLLENTRFHKEEEKNDPAFVEQLAKLGDIYVNDAFSAAHRAHASTEGLARKLPAYAGRTMQAELEALGKALEQPQRPVIAIVGGAKVSTKLELLENLIDKVQALVIGGAMANTFLHAQGINVQKSLAEKDMADTARRILAKAEDANCAIILPVDAIVAFHFQANAPSHAYGLDAIPADGMILDVGPQSIERIKGAIDDAATLVWNGPLGAFEMPPFDPGTVDVARYAAARTKAGKLVSVAGGGDTVAALNAADVAEQVHLCVDRRRRVPRMAGGPQAPRRRGAVAPERLTPAASSGRPDVNALVMIAITSIGPRVPYRRTSARPSSPSRISTRSSGMISTSSGTSGARPAVLVNRRGFLHAFARLAGQAEELRDVVGRGNSDLEQERPGHAALSVRVPVASGVPCAMPVMV